MNRGYKEAYVLGCTGDGCSSARILWINYVGMARHYTTLHYTHICDDSIGSGVDRDETGPRVRKKQRGFEIEGFFGSFFI